MERVILAKLPYTERGAALVFLKHLWREEGADYPFCGAPLELLHKKAKKTTATGSAVRAARSIAPSLCLKN